MPRREKEALSGAGAGTRERLALVRSLSASGFPLVSPNLQLPPALATPPGTLG